MYIPNDKCEESSDPRYPDNYQGLIFPVMMCAVDDGQDSCQGDSGGPLIIEGSSLADDVLAGVVSW